MAIWEVRPALRNSYRTAWVSFGKQTRVTSASAEGGSAKLVNDRSCPLVPGQDGTFAGDPFGRSFRRRRWLSRAGTIKEPSGCFHQVDRLAARALEPPSEVTTAGLRRLGVGLTDDRSPAVTTGLSSVVDLERLGAVATRIAAAAPERTIPTGSLHRGGATHRTSDDAGLNLS